MPSKGDSQTRSAGLVGRRQGGLNGPALAESLTQGASREVARRGPLADCLGSPVPFDQYPSEVTACNDGFCKNSFNGPSEVHSVLKPSAFDAETLSPCGHAHRFAVERKHFLGASIAGLLFSRRPSAVGWLVVSVVVYAVYLMSCGWPLSHVGQEVCKRLPSFADGDATSAVSRITNVCFPLASSSHHAPTGIRKTSGLAMRNASLTSYVALEASTASLSPTHESAPVGQASRSAVAFALPNQEGVPSASCEPNHCQSSKPLSCKVWRIVKTWSGRRLARVDCGVVRCFHLVGPFCRQCTTPEGI